MTEQVIRGGVTLTKVDKDYPENKLEGAVFEVYRDSNRNQELDAEDELLGTICLLYTSRGMMPRNTVTKDSLKRLHIYAGEQHIHEAQKPELVK